MKLDAQEIEQLVNETEDKRATWARAATIWEKDYFLERYNDNREDKQDLDGVDIVVSPDPFNVIQLLQRFVAHEMRVEIPNITDKDESAERSQLLESWLLAFDVLSNRQQGCNHINDMTWQSGVLGRGAAQVLWIGDVIPDGISTERILPIWRRTLDPRNVGVARGPYWTDYGFHKYDSTEADIKQRYPKYKLPDRSNGKLTHGYWNEKYEVIDFWCRHQGAIWHSVSIDKKFAMGPVKTDYPDIPIIEWYADGAPVNDDLGRSLSILHPIHELWKMKCDIMSKVATGLMYHYDPLMVATGNFNDTDRKQVREAGPGGAIFLREGQSLVPFSPQPNVPMAQALLAMIQTGIDQATFPGVTYGDAPGGVNAGFAINNLAQQAQARATTIRQNIEAAVESENQLILAQIEVFAPEDGVEIYTRKNKGERGKPLKLTAKIIKGNYDNQVRLLPERPIDDTQKLLGWSTLVDKGLISAAFFRDEAMNVQAPRDEETNIRVERALKSPQMQLKADMLALMHSKPQEEWDMMFLSTEYWPIYQEYIEWDNRKKEEAKAEKERKAAEKEAQRMQEALANMAPSIAGLPTGTMPPMMPPMPPELMTQQGLPMAGQPQEMSGFPLGSPPPSMMQPEGLPGLPPQMAGQMTPDMLGMGGMPGGSMDMLMGGPPPSDEDLMQQLGGMPPQF